MSAFFSPSVYGLVSIVLFPDFVIGVLLFFFGREELVVFFGRSYIRFCCLWLFFRVFCACVFVRLLPCLLFCSPATPPPSSPQVVVFRIRGLFESVSHACCVSLGPLCANMPGDGTLTP